MGNEERTNLTLEKLREVIDPFLQESRRLQKELQDCLEKLAKEHQIKLGDFVIIHESWYEQLPAAKPYWLKGSRMINRDEAYIVRGTPMKMDAI